LPLHVQGFAIQLGHTASFAKDFTIVAVLTFRCAAVLGQLLADHEEFR